MSEIRNVISTHFDSTIIKAFNLLQLQIAGASPLIEGYPWCKRFRTDKNNALGSIRYSAGERWMFLDKIIIVQFVPHVYIMYHSD